MLKTVWILFAFLFHFLLLPIEIVNSLINLLIKIKKLFELIAYSQFVTFNALS